MEKQIVTSGKLLAGFAAVFALALLLVANVSAATSSFGSIDRVEINGVDASSGTLAQFAGQRVSVLIVFDATGATDYAEDVRVKAWISGERENLFTSDEEFAVIGGIYSFWVFVDMPSDLDETEEARTLEVVVESKLKGELDEKSVDLTVQRKSHLLDVLDVDFSPEVKAGDTLTLDVVTKNIGRQDAEDTFVSARIPALGLDDRAYFGDLTFEDRGNPDKDDTVERRLFLRIPAGTPAGVYDVEVQAFNDDSITTLNRKVVVRAQSTDTVIVSGTASKTFAVGQEADYSITLVNAGDRVQVYELIPETSSGLTVNVEEPIVAIPAGSSRTVKVTAQADKAGDYNFAVNVNSDSALIKRQSFAAKVEGTNAFSGGNAGNTTVLLTVVLAIIFVVLLVVLIVLLTRKPQKSEEFGESYY